MFMPIDFMIVAPELYKKPDLLPELSYIGRDCTAIPSNLISQFGSRVKRLDLSFNCLESLKGLEHFPNLEELVLDNNELSDRLSLPHLPMLHTLTLNKNKIQDLDSLLDILSKCTPCLTYLSLLGNEACPNQLSSSEKDEEDYQRYRYYVLHKIPKLKFLDSSLVKKEEREEALRKGAYLKVVRPKDDSDDSPRKKSEDGPPSQYSPLPQSTRAAGDHKSMFSKCHYQYYGKHSEGNRFIRNNDL